MALVCASYELGHNVHGLHALAARRDPRRPATITHAAGVDLMVGVAGDVVRYRTHSAEELLSRVAESDGDLHLIEDWHLLVLQGERGGLLFSLAPVDVPWLPCKPVPPGPFPYPERPPWGSRKGERKHAWE